MPIRHRLMGLQVLLSVAAVNEKVLEIAMPGTRAPGPACFVAGKSGRANLAEPELA